MIDKAKKYGCEMHAKVNHLYDGKPYETHLSIVERYCKKYAGLVEEPQRENFISSAWVHDIIEDCRETYNDVKKELNEEIAELVYAVTNEKGKTRKERASEKYYSEMKLVPNAVLLKLCDRLANVYYSAQSGSRMLKAYKKEHEEFKILLFDEKYKEVFEEIESYF
jgi:(p)ppGpp synthase/HD superfamily hydrolase